MMKYEIDAYVTPEELKRKGFVIREDGTVYRRSVLEMIYEDTDWLKNHFKGKKTRRHEMFEIVFNDFNRFTVAKRLHNDYRKAGLDNVKANDTRKCKVDGCGSRRRPEYLDDAEDRYIRAMRRIPQLHRKIVEAVCIDGIMIEETEAYCLRKGLDFLIRHYFSEK